MTSITNVNTQSTEALYSTNTVTTSTTSTSTTVPDAQTVTQQASTLSTPTLAAPRVSGNVAGMSLENLVASLSLEERKISADGAIDAIESRAEERKTANEEKIKSIQDNLAAEKKESKLSGLKKAFSIFVKIATAIASVATIAAGVITANPLLIAGGAILATMAVNDIVSAATDGKVSISAGIGAAVKACGGSDEAAQWTGFAFEMAITLVGVGLSLGGSIAGAAASKAAKVADVATKTVETATKTANISDAAVKAANLASNAEKASKITKIATQIANIASATAQFTGAAVEIASALNQKDIADNKAFMKEIEALLERMQIADALDMESLEELLSKNQELLGIVSEIVEGSAQTQMTILTNTTSLA